MQDLDAQHDRLYLIVRGDLPPGLAAAQAAHAAFEFSAQHPDLVRPWLAQSKYLVLVTVPDEDALIGLASRALQRGIRLTSWHEPDMANALTAIALEPGPEARRCTANLPLLGRPTLEATG